MPTSLKPRHALMVAGISVFLSFQNCAQPPEVDSSSVSSFSSSLPLAYDMKLDTIAHMSCSEIKTDVEPRAYFSYRAGAYNNATGGLSITPEFKNATRFYTNTARTAVFSDSTANMDTSLNLSIRSSANYQSPYVSDQFNLGEEQDAFLPDLTSPEIAGPLGSMQPGVYMNYFPGAHSKRLMEASLRYFKFESVAKDARTQLDSRAALLVAALADSSDPMETAIRGPNGIDTKTGYGSGFYMRFSLPAGYNGGERRVISPSGGIEEIDLATGLTKSSNFSCSSSYQFMIVRPEDQAAGRVICNPTVDRFTDVNQQAALNAIRRVLRVEDWFVDLNNRCVMPKRTGDYCYGALAGRAIQYGVANCLNSTTTLCPHFVSVCIRQ